MIVKRIFLGALVTLLFFSCTRDKDFETLDIKNHETNLYQNEVLETTLGSKLPSILPTPGRSKSGLPCHEYIPFSKVYKRTDGTAMSYEEALIERQYMSTIKAKYLKIPQFKLPKVISIIFNEDTQFYFEIMKTMSECQSPAGGEDDTDPIDYGE